MRQITLPIIGGIGVLPVNNYILTEFLLGYCNDCIASGSVLPVLTFVISLNLYFSFYLD